MLRTSLFLVVGAFRTLRSWASWRTNAKCGVLADEMRRVGGWILQVLRSPDDQSLLQNIRGQVAELCRHFPVPGDQRVC